jgi:penicillin amidase
MRHLALGRVAEMIGPLGVPVDRLLRVLDFGRAVPAILADMPGTTREWLDGFVQGLNHCLRHCTALPPEFGLFALRREPWSVADVVTVGRLASADVNWITWSQLLKFHDDAAWPGLWRKLMNADRLSSWAGSDRQADSGGMLENTLGATPRTGSNSFVLAPQRSATGAALIASDPHLSLSLPSPWLLAAYRSPSYHAVGMMIPGLPFIALGRNETIAWGGTSLHAASSDLIAVPDSAVATMDRREVTMAVRWGGNRAISIRESAWGPVVSDPGLLPTHGRTLAMRWMGHRPSDEFSAMLAVNRARDWNEFQDALEGFALPGQTMLYADTAGHIGRSMAVHLPRRSDALPQDMILPPAASEGWDVTLTSRGLPATLDPAEGYIASANERPAPGAPVVGYLFSPPDRKRRLDRLLGSSGRRSVEDVARIQRDVHSAAALALCRQLLGWIDLIPHPGPRERRLVAALAGWDGDYTGASRGALAYELLLGHLARRLVEHRRRATYDAAWGSRRLIWDDIQSADPHRRQRALRLALRGAALSLGGQATWGDRHRLRLGHMLAMVPVLGRAWRFTDLAAEGSGDTLHKTSHSLTGKRHGTGFGAGARHISDLSEPDHNYFVLLGGQDGWIGSSTFMDQVPLWRRGEYITVPLRPETAQAVFPHCTELVP